MDDSDFQTLGAASILTKKVAEWKGEPTKISGMAITFSKKQKEVMNCVIEQLTRWCDVLGKGIANICYVINPEIVVLGGGIMAQEEFLKDRIKEHGQVSCIQHCQTHKACICETSK